jgi:hypothetical protein
MAHGRILHPPNIWGVGRAMRCAQVRLTLGAQCHSLVIPGTHRRFRASPEAGSQPHWLRRFHLPKVNALERPGFVLGASRLAL